MRDHIIEVTDTGWTLMHPIACRPNLFTCPANTAAGQLIDPPAAGPGRYLCGVDPHGHLTVGDRTEQAATPTDLVLADIARERQRQHEKWGGQNHPDGTGGEILRNEAQMARNACRYAAQRGRLTWKQILREEVTAAFAETDAAALRAELIQVAAVAVAWAEAIDQRTDSGRRPC